MTALPQQVAKKLGLVIDLDTCVGCHACATSCKQWNDTGHSAPLTDYDPYGASPDGVWFNRVHTYEVSDQGHSRTVNFPPQLPALRQRPVCDGVSYRGVV